MAKQVKDIEEQFGEGVDWNLFKGVLPDPQSYYPTRLEYFAGKALQGMVTGRAVKDYRSCVLASITLAAELEEEIDKFTATQD